MSLMKVRQKKHIIGVMLSQQDRPGDETQNIRKNV